MHLVVTNTASIAIGWGVLSWVVPPFAKEIGVRPQLIGLLLFANAAAVVVAQVPVAKIAEGRRRVVMMAVGATLIAAACLLVLSGQTLGRGAYAALVVAAVTIGIGECFHTVALMPLVADLAPESLRGRYMATTGLSWWIGLALAPTLGTRLLSTSATLTFGSAAAIAAAAAASMLTLDVRLPDAARRTPRPEPARGSSVPAEVSAEARSG